MPFVWPAPYEDPPIPSWRVAGHRDQQPGPYGLGLLESRDVTGCFCPYPYGRPQDLNRLKPQIAEHHRWKPLHQLPTTRGWGASVSLRQRQVPLSHCQNMCLMLSRVLGP